MSAKPRRADDRNVREFPQMEPGEGIARGAGRLAGGLAAAALIGSAAASPAPAGVSEQKPLSARGSVEQVQVTDATPGARVMLLRHGEKVDAQRAGELGGVVFRHVEPGRGYRVSEPSAGGRTQKLRVLTPRSKPPSKAIYDQDLPDGGYGYLNTRDGTKLAINVHLPGPADQGPYPTLVEYSGYGYADPSGPAAGIQPLAELLGYAVVDVNMRGTGCSGGAFDYFERLQSLDGYDVVETVARQPWVMHGKVGMLGISYGGISQLFVAATRPPNLAAITPLSVIDSTQTTLYPGGILNTGFALEWAEDRVEDSRPAGPDSGQPWAWRRIEDGDQIVQGEPGSASRGRQHGREDSTKPLLPATGGRPGLPDQVRQADRGSGLPRMPVAGRADRRPLPGARQALQGNEAEVVHVHQRRPL